jgi:V/A-type H+-transporting ATPase subunit D
MSDLIPTRGTALALAEEKNLIETGFGFLDEKRILLATNLLRELKEWQQVLEEYRIESESAADALKSAVWRHGLEGIQLYPAPRLGVGTIPMKVTNYLGVKLTSEPDLNWDVEPVIGAVDASAQAEDCRQAFAMLVPLAARIAVKQSNIARLIKEYRATERRARALENVLLPEATAALRKITDYLDEADQEEAIRIRNAAG